MSSVGFDGSSISRLEGSSDAPGGLIVRKTSEKNTSKSSTGGSLLGLQKLAEEKRKEREFELEKLTKKQKSINWEEPEDERTSSAKHRHYRPKMVETPSHPGGVSDEYKEKKKRRDEREREQRKGGVYADTKKRKNKDSVREERRDKYSEEGSKRDRSSRSRGDSTRSTRGRYDWEETPSSRRSRDEREYTPSRSSKGWYDVGRVHIEMPLETLDEGPQIFRSMLDYCDPL